MAVAKVIAVTTRDKPEDRDRLVKDGREITLELIQFEPVVDGQLMDVGEIIELDVRRA